MRLVGDLMCHLVMWHLFSLRPRWASLPMRPRYPPLQQLRHRAPLAVPEQQQQQRSRRARSSSRPRCRQQSRTRSPMRLLTVTTAGSRLQTLRRHRRLSVQRLTVSHGHHGERHFGQYSSYIVAAAAVPSFATFAIHSAVLVPIIALCQNK